jgi:hypothetical protein
MSQNKQQVNITVNAEETIESCLTPVVKMLLSLPGNLLSVQQAQSRLFEFRAWISTALIETAALQTAQANLASQREQDIHGPKLEPEIKKGCGNKNPDARCRQIECVDCWEKDKEKTGLKLEPETKKEKPKSIKEAREALKK